MPKEEPENDLCRCCHAEGAHKNLYESYFWLDVEEVVYSKLLQECFDIEMAPITQPLQQMLCAICDTCVERLQDAVKFKRQVLKCEKRFRDVYGSCVSEDSTFEVKVKQEIEVEIKGDVSTSASVNGANANTSAMAESFRMMDDDDDGLSDRDGDDFKQTSEDATVKVKKEVDTSDSEDDMFLNEVSKTTKRKTKSPAAAKKTKVARTAKKNPEPGAEDEEELQVIQEGKTTKRGKTKSAAPAVKKKTGKINPESAEDEELVTIDGISVIKVKRSRLRRDVDFKVIGDDFQCLRCPVVAKNDVALRIHIKSVHLNTAKYKCSTCFTLFWSLGQLVKHLLEEHNIDRRLKCNACPKVFLAKQALTNHVNGFHMLRDKLKCKECDYETYNKQSFSTHKIHHSAEKKHKCQYCQKAFKRKNTLQLHERIHTGDKRKACAECGKAFIDRTSLKYHMTRHHPGVNF